MLQIVHYFVVFSDLGSKCLLLVPKLGGIRHSEIPKIEHITGFATFQVPRGYFVVFRKIRQENKTPLTMAKNGGPFRETAVILLASLPAPMPIRLRQALQISPPQGLTEPKFQLSHLWQHNSHRFCCWLDHE